MGLDNDTNPSLEHSALPEEKLCDYRPVLLLPSGILSHASEIGGFFTRPGKKQQQETAFTSNQNEAKRQKHVQALTPASRAFIDLPSDSLLRIIFTCAEEQQEESSSTEIGKKSRQEFHHLGLMVVHDVCV